jgi:serine/threonine-protein kinase RsbW
MISGAPIIQLRLPSSFDHLDLVQLVSDRLAGVAGLDEDATHWVGVSVRESVINAVKHGNRESLDKEVVVEFKLLPLDQPNLYEFSVEVLDQGEGFEPDTVGNPLDPQNILKSSGRGIFFMRNFMDDVVIKRRPEGGMSVRMTKRVAIA